MTIDKKAKELLLREEKNIYYNNGQIKEQYYLIDGKLEGEIKIWHENGQLWTHCFYKDDELDGEIKS